jgi:hypothetical protein
MFGLFESTDVELVNDGGVFTELREFIEKADEDVLLVAPYIDPNDDLVRVLKEATRRVGVEIWFRADKTDEYRGQPWFRDLTDEQVLFRSVKNLHAKLYLIDDRCIITSMNLTKSSWNNSREFGCILGLDGKHGQKVIDYVEPLEREASECCLPRSSTS